MVAELKTPRSRREQAARRSRENTAAVADIGDIPPVENPDRREACREDLHRFLTTYFPQSTGRKPFSEDHVRAIGRLQRCILEGGLFVQVFPRGFAKTTISENAAVWATVYGHRKFVPIFGADANAAAGNIDSIKLELSENDLLYADFPEVCHAVRALENKPQRCASQTHGGDLTHIEWRADTIVLPTIAGSAAGGCIITARGLLGGSRGMKHKRPDGTQQRPDFVLLDDPQTDESASTALQVNKRLDTLRKSILKLGGHDRKIAVVCNATVIRPDDLVEQLLNPKKFPAWQGERIKMVRAFAAAHETLWLGDYQKLRNTFDPHSLGDQQRAHREATEFYRRNRAAMDAGCEVSWEHCYDADTELSAIQHAYNLLIDDGEEVFASECQNEPLAKVEDGAEETMTADAIAAKVNGIPRGTLPGWATRLVAFVDVQKSVLFWVAAAFGDDFTGAVVDYGTWPDQRRAYFTASDARVTMQKATGRAGEEEALYAGLDTLAGVLMGRDWKRDDGASLKPEKVVIDANYATDTIKLFCRQSAHAANLLPSHGRYCGATSRAFNDYQRKPGDKVGVNCRVTKEQGGPSRYLLFDTNYWKSFVHSRLKVGMGGRGCLSLFGREAAAHRMIADHWTAEKGVEVEAKGRRVVEWKLPPSRPDNHWWDCIVGCHVAAGLGGSRLIERAASGNGARRVKLSELQRERKVWRAKAS